MVRHEASGSSLVCWGGCGRGLRGVLFCRNGYGSDTGCDPHFQGRVQLLPGYWWICDLVYGGVEMMAYRAVFSGWIMPAASFGNPRGPFTVEVYEYRPKSSSAPVWRARLLPTKQEFSGLSFRNRQDTKNSVSSMFEAQVEPWAEVEDGKEAGTG